MKKNKAMKVLLIEDDCDVQDGITKFLQEAGFSVELAANGPEGLYRAVEWTYDVIILDVMLPEMDGWGVLKNLRKARVNTPVLMLTALGETSLKVKGLDEGADDYMVKPYNAHELVARVRALSRRTPLMSDEVISIGRVSVNTRDCYVELDGETVDLTASQFRIVAYLARRIGRYVSRSDLVDTVCGDDEEKNSNVLEVQVYHIRRKLGKEFIKSRRGFGYVIEKSS